MRNPFEDMFNQGIQGQPDIYGGYSGYVSPGGGMRVTKQDLVNFIMQDLNASEVVKCDEFETMRTRHICPGTKQIRLLEKNVYNVPTPSGLVPVGVIFCPNCRKLWIDKNTLDFM